MSSPVCGHHHAAAPGFQWSDDDWIPISALQHYSYCPRQCALIHVDQVWVDNSYTARGSWVHQRVDVEGVRSARGYRVLTALPVWSEQLGLTGKCDVVEMRDGVPYPVEFKIGAMRRRRARHDNIQLAAQALCLEEMFGVPVAEGAVFHVASHRRRRVEIGEELRQEVTSLVQLVRDMLHRGEIPPPVRDRRCEACSLRPVCLPEIPENSSGWVSWVERELGQQEVSEA
ncbi:MAG: CRISPR-associated protein Cas4 [Alicyclobacillus sp.]|nr:CRISPR-associated protein Cas4 [Alicyclobacillus sp.]